MEKIIKRTKFPPMVFMLLGLILVYVAYWLAGGQDRVMPRYAFPEPAFDCEPVHGEGRPNKPPPQLSRGYSQSELLWCYPPQYFPLYALAILGLIVCGWTLIIGGKGIFQRARRSKENLLDGIGAMVVFPIMVLTGVRIFKLEISWFGSADRPPDIFNSLALISVLMALLVAIFGVASIIVGTIKAIGTS